jgi:hypothetical protein
MRTRVEGLAPTTAGASLLEAARVEITANAKKTEPALHQPVAGPPPWRGKGRI